MSATVNWSGFPDTDQFFVVGFKQNTDENIYQWHNETLVKQRGVLDHFDPYGFIILFRAMEHK